MTEARQGLYCNTVTVPTIQQGHGRWAGLGAPGVMAGPVGARALDLIFKPVFRLGIFPESPNEHCSL